MNMNATFVLLIISFLMCGQSGAAVYNWTGTADNDVFNESNWELEGSPGTYIPQINPNTPVNQHLVISTGTPDIGAGALQLGEALGSLTISGNATPTTVNGGVRAQEGSGTFTKSIVHISGTSQTTIQFILDIDLTLTDSASLTFKGGGNPVNRSVINITSPAASIQYNSETTTAFLSEHLGKISVAGAPAVVGSNPAVLEPGDNLLVISNGGSGCIVTPNPSAFTAAVNVSPVNGQTGVDVNTEIQWAASDAFDVVGYDVYFGADPTPSNNSKVVDGENVTTYLPDETLSYAATYYWRVDSYESGNTVPYTGDVWSFTTGGKASDPHPADGTSAKDSDRHLSWTGDTMIASYDVYFGNPGSMVFVGNYSSASVSFVDLAAAMGIDKLAQGLYQWQVDARDADGILMTTGDLWTVTIPAYVPTAYKVIDNFEKHVDTGDLLVLWNDGSTNDTGSSIELDNLLNLMRLDYDNTVSPWKSEIQHDFDPPQDWTYDSYDQLHSLSFSFRGVEGNSSESIYIVLSDGVNDARLTYEDTAATSGQWWKTWNIRLADFEALGVDTGNVTQLTIGIGSETEAGQSGVLYINDVLVYPYRCLPEFQAIGDVNADCVVDIFDIAILADDWLIETYTVDATPPTINPVVHYSFEETSGHTANDSSTNNYNATIAPDTASGFWNTDGYLGRCIEINDTDLELNMPPDIFSTISNEITISMWIYGQTDLIPDPVETVELMAGAADLSNTWDRLQWDIVSPDQYEGWNHYALVKDSGRQLMQVYVNGILVAEKTEAAQSLSGQPDSITVLSLVPGQEVSPVRVDEFRIYDTALSHQEIVHLARGQGGQIVQPISPVLTKVDIVDDGVINLEDFAKAASYWLTN